MVLERSNRKTFMATESTRRSGEWKQGQDRAQRLEARSLVCAELVLECLMACFTKKSAIWNLALRMRCDTQSVLAHLSQIPHP